jgi:hypothetical protein
MNRGWHRVLAYDPLMETCTLAPASGSQAGLLRDVPIALWGGSDYGQQRSAARLTQPVDAGQWGSTEGGPRWGVSFPVQQNDLAQVSHVDGDQSRPVITAFLRGTVGSPAIAPVGVEQGESAKDRFDLLLPSGAWCRSLEDGSWVVATGPVGAAAASIRIGADGTITLTGGALVVDCPTVTINGVTDFTESGQTIGGKEISVIGGVDSAGHSNVASGQ